MSSFPQGETGGRSSRGASRYQRQFGNFRSLRQRGQLNLKNEDDDGPKSKAAFAAQMRRAKQVKGNALDRNVMRVEEFMPSSSSTGAPDSNASLSSKQKSRRGWLYNVLPTTVRKKPLRIHVEVCSSRLSS